MIEHANVPPSQLRQYADDGWRVCAFIPGEPGTSGYFIMERATRNPLTWVLAVLLVGASILGIALATMHVPIATP
jgi:hypothetical protein